MLLEPGPADNVMPQVSEVVVPVIQADKILQTPTASGLIENNLTGTSYVTSLTVPNGEEWFLCIIFHSGTAAPTSVRCVQTGVTQQLTSTTTSETLIYPTNIILRTGDTIGMSGTGSGSDTATKLSVMYLLSDVAS